MFFKTSKVWYLAYEDEVVPDPKENDDGPLYTQEELDTKLKTESEKYKTQLSKTLGELNALKTKSNLTQEEREKLEQHVTDLEQQLLTKEELAKKEQDKLHNEHQEVLKNLTTERDTWQQKFTSSTINQAITDAAVANNAFSPKQIIAILRPMTSLKDDKPTVKYPDKDDKGKDIELVLSVPEAVKKMSEQQEYLNLFKTEATKGLAERSMQESETFDIKEIAKNQQKYEELRKAGKI